MLPDTEATHTNQLCPAQGEKNHTVREEFPYNWRKCRKELFTIDFIPLVLHCRSINSASIPFSVMCNSFTAIISSENIATQDAGGVDGKAPQAVFNRTLFNQEVTKSMLSTNHNCGECVCLSASTTFCVAEMPQRCEITDLAALCQQCQVRD